MRKRSRLSRGLGKCIGGVIVILVLLSAGAGRPPRAIPSLDVPHHAHAWRTAFREVAPRADSPADAAVITRLEAMYRTLPVAFEANRGQSAPQVKFLYRGAQQTVYLTPTQAVLAL